MYEDIKAKYSIVIYNSEADDFSELIRNCIKKGIKVILFDNINYVDLCGEAKRLDYDKIYNFENDPNAQFLFTRYEYENYDDEQYGDIPHYIVDNEYVKWLPNFPLDAYWRDPGGNEEEELTKDRFFFWPAGFNKAQYDVEHATTKHKALIVKASAGTGKTKVMIDRIMFLLLTQPDLQLKDICMVTFTNDAANQMMERLQKRLGQYYSCTHDVKFIRMMEQLPSMNISTIDSLFKDLIQRNGFALGYNKDTKIQNFSMERDYIVSKAIDNVIRSEGENFSIKELSVPLYMINTLILKLWNQMESKGYFYDQNARRLCQDRVCFNHIKDLDLVAKINILNTLIADALTESIHKYEELTYIYNALSLSDVKKKLLCVTDALKKQKRWKYIFVDEFQDTDDSQIRVISALAQSEYCKQLFVVGDIKQSIYRFRGATDNAFALLKSQMTDYEEHRLVVNYRTVADVQEKLNDILNSMAKDNTWFDKEDIAVESYSKASGKAEIISYDNLQVDFIEKLRKIRKSSPNKNICILTRTNKQVGQVAGWCRNADIPWCAKTSGGFYLSRPVTDLYCVLGYWMYPQNKIWKYNVSKTVYYSVDLSVYFAKLDTVSLFKILEKLIGEVKPWEKMSNPYLREYYQMNLSKFLKLLYDRFSEEYVSLATLFSYVKSCINNPSIQESEVYPQVQDNSVEIMTVHKAKGMEWDIVFIPFTDDPVIYKNIGKDFYDFTFSKEQNRNILNIGWCLIKSKRKRYSKDYENTLIANENYLSEFDTEYKDIQKELARVLYVAMTRCKEQLYCFVPVQHSGLWAKWLMKEGEL